jgi:hypothetical protein
VYNNDRISDVDKFYYLKGKLTGQTRRVLAGLSLSNDAVAVKILKERYSDKQEIIELHYKGLLNICSPKINREFTFLECQN